jgi:tetratricopeptide (TPR) repeat protein
MVQNFHLVWLDGNIDEVNNDDCRKSIIQLRQVVNTVNTFIDVDECIDFINDIQEEKTFMICSGALGQTTVPLVHDKLQVSTIYIFCENTTWHEEWVKEWPKVKGLYTDITSICEALKQAAHDCDQNSVSISFIKTADGATNQNLDQLDRSFMYTQILKEILPTIDFQQSHIDEFLTHCREQFVGNSAELENVDKIETEYIRHQPIWWYTFECFLYSMLNKTLRTMEVDCIIKMGFFIRDLHDHIAALHSEQYGGHSHSESFTVYYGQGLSQTDFDQLKKTQDGLLSFNNFLFTSQNRNVSLDFVRRTITTSNLVGVLFILQIDPSISATPFAKVRDASCHQGEEEILFSMHSVFRIGQMKQIDKNDRLWQVDLTVTGDGDSQLHALTERIREETKGSIGWLRLGKVMVKVAEFDKAEDLYKILLSQTSDERDKGDIYYQLGWIKTDQGQYTEAIKFYKKSLKIRHTMLTSQHPDLAECYNDLGVVYDSMGEYSKALSFHKKALEIYRKILPANHPHLATSYTCHGSVYDNIGEYSKALWYYERALQIEQTILPSNHPDLATSYNNIAGVYDSIDEYSKALSYYEKSLEIKQETLPANHPSLATSYNNIGNVYYYIGEYSKALSYYERTLDIWQRSLPSNHPYLQIVTKSIGIVKEKL